MNDPLTLEYTLGYKAGLSGKHKRRDNPYSLDINTQNYNIYYTPWSAWRRGFSDGFLHQYNKKNNTEIK